MGYCLSCEKEQKTGKFCLTCGLQLSSNKDEIDPANPIALKSGKTNLAVWAHLAPLITAFVGLFMGGFPLVLLWLPGLLIRNSSRATDFERRHATESMNLQFTSLLFILAYTVVGIFIWVAQPLSIVITVPLLAIFGIIAVIFSIVAASAASAGKEYKYPVCIRFVK
jgi:uncharacterized Tic20 family protein